MKVINTVLAQSLIGIQFKTLGKRSAISVSGGSQSSTGFYEFDAHVSL